MLRSIYTKTLRDYRAAILGWGLGLGVMLYANIAAFATQIATPRARAELAQLAQTFRFLAEPVEVTTPTGFATWRILGIMPLLLGIWAALAGARLTRGAEERGSLDLVLATPRGRGRYLAEGVAAIATALAIVGALLGLGALAGEATAGVPVAPGGALLAGLNVALLALVTALLALLLSQLARRAGVAAGAAIALLIAAWVLDGTGRVAPQLAWLGTLSPFRLYARSKPLIASHGTDPAALLALLALAALLGVAAATLFARRDLGGVAWPGAGSARGRTVEGALAAAARAPSLRGMARRALRAELSSVVGWLAGLVLYVGWIVGIARATRDNLRGLLAESPALQQLLGGATTGTDAAFLSGLLFAFLPLLLTLYALGQAGAWARALDAGRLELVLATPIPRWRAFLASWFATLVTLLAAPLVVWIVALASFRLFALQVAADRLAAAFLGLLPLELVIAALVALLAGRLPAGAITGLGGAVIVVSFAAELLAPVLSLPGWLANLSLFHHYGNPVLDGPRWGPWLGLTALAAALFALGLLRFARGDLARGS